MVLDHLNYAILALGSKEYPDSYCAFGHRVDLWLKQSGAHALFDVIEVDNAHPDDIQNGTRHWPVPPSLNFSR